MNTISVQEMQELYDEHHRNLFLYSKKFIKDDIRAQDSVQEVFARLLKQDWDKVKGYVNQWLYIVCRNYTLRQMKNNNRFVEIFDTDIDKLDESKSPLEELELQEKKIILKKILKKLTKREREVIKYRFFQGLNYESTAKKIKSSTGNVGFHQNSAINRLKILMSKELAK